MDSKDLSVIKAFIKILWTEPLFSDLTSKKIDVSLYPELNKTIPDKFIIIGDVFSEADMIDWIKNTAGDLELQLCLSD